MVKLCAAVLVFLSIAAQAADRPRICVVLSGGGARGAAHIGVLKVLEEYRVPIDCIAGTSMGALVGAAYATGSTTAEMEEMVGNISTDLLFNERPPRRELSVRRKQEDQTILVGPEIGVRDGQFLLQKGVVSGVQLETVLRRLSKVRGYRRFDELPIPFRAVATDLVAGRAVVFGDGELAAVMRASMSVPGAIAPTEIGDMLLVDGGLTNNLPIDIGREMGADIVIAVNLGTPLMKRKELNSIVDVTGQMIFILTEQNVQASIATLKPRDVLIEPELGNFSFSDFDHLPQTIPIGEAAARKVAGFLSRLGLSHEEYAALRRKQLAIPAADTRPVDAITFEGLTRVNPEVVATMLSTKTGEPIDQDVLDRDIRRLYGTGDFEHVGYRFLDEAGKRVLAIEAVEKSWGPNYLRLGLGLASDFQGDAFFNILASYRRTWINSLGGEWRNVLQVGRTNAIQSELYQPLHRSGYLFVAPRVEAAQSPTDVYEGNRRLARYNFTRARIGFDVGSQFTQYGEVRVGLMRGFVDAKLSTGSGDFAQGLGRVQQGVWTSRLFIDQLDSINFPRSGFNVGFESFASRTALGSDDNYTKWMTAGDFALSHGDHTVLAGVTVGGKSGAAALPVYDLFQWGGFLQQSGYRPGALLGDHLDFGRLIYYRRIVRQTLLEGIYVGASLEMGRMRGSPFPDTPTGWIKSGALFVGLDSFIGPIYFGYGRSSGGFGSFYFYLGKPWGF
jgi:NTE family protein